MRRTAELGTDFWNDSCALGELAEAVEHGAVGATSNPVIVGQVVEGDREAWVPVIDGFVASMPEATENELAWALIGEMARRASALLLPSHRSSGKLAGYLSVQVDPRLFRDAHRMVEQATTIARLAPNIAVKVPATEAGLAVIETLTGRGVRINATVCTTFPQAVACAEAVERGLGHAREAGLDITTLRPNVTIMVGRLDDHLRRVMEARRVTIAPGSIDWAGIAVFKKAHREFRARGYRSQLLAAAFRHHLHWFELVGEGVAQTIPYAWWTRFNASGLEPGSSLDRPVDPSIVEELLDRLPDFRVAYGEEPLLPAAFASFGASAHTLQQFLGGAARLDEIVRARLVR